MKKRSVILSLVFVIIAGLVFGSGENRAVINDIGEEAKIGFNLELTGPLRYYGEGTLNGVMMAFDEINQAGGTNGVKIVPIIGDNRSDPERAAFLANRLITRDGVVTTIGPSTSFNFMETIPTHMAYKIPTISSHSSADQVTVAPNGDAYDYVYRTTFNDSFQGTTMANFALNNLDAKRAITIEQRNNVYSEGLAMTFRKAFEEAGGTIVSREIYEGGDKNFSSMLNKIKEEEFDVIFLPAYYEEAGLIIQQARQLGISVPFLATDAVDTPILLEIAGPSALNNVYLTTNFSPIDPNPMVQNFISAYRERYGREPISSDARGYDTGYFIADAIKRAGSTDPEALRNAYASTENFTGVTGTFTMGEDHNPIASILVIGLVNGIPATSVEVQPK